MPLSPRTGKLWLTAVLCSAVFALGGAAAQAAKDIKTHWGIIQDVEFRVIYEQNNERSLPGRFILKRTTL